MARLCFGATRSASFAEANAIFLEVGFVREMGNWSATVELVILIPAIILLDL